MSFIPCDRNQLYLLPPSLEDWIPEGHLARCIADVVDHFDLSMFAQAYNPTGVGGKPFPPNVMISVMLYSYCNGVRSSRRIEKLCTENIAVRYLTANKLIDHTTINRFRQRHEQHLRSVFIEILRQCQEMGLVKVGLLALDGTKIKANASIAANRTEEKLEKEVQKMLEEAAATDKEEDRKHGKKGKEEDLPEGLQTKEARMAKFKEAKERLAAEKEAVRAEQARKIAEREAEEAASGCKKRGRKPKTPDEINMDEAQVNITDPESQIMKARTGFVQGYNAQAVVTADQIIVAAEVTQEANDQKQLVPMLVNAEENIKDLGVTEGMGLVLVDAGYPNEAVLATAEEHGWDVLAATKKDWKQRKAAREEPFPQGRIPQDATRMQRMTRRMLTKEGRERYKKRGQTVEPVFGQIKFNLGHDRFSRRGFSACQSEWFLICGAHNLLKFWRASRLVSQN